MHTLFPHYPLLKIKFSFGQTLRGNKQCCIHRLLESIKQLATLLCQASRGFTMASPISPPPKPLSKKKVRFSKDGQMQKTHQELPMLRLCHRAGHQDPPKGATGPTRGRVLEGLGLTADLLSDGLLLGENP